MNAVIKSCDQNSLGCFRWNKVDSIHSDGKLVDGSIFPPLIPYFRFCCFLSSSQWNGGFSQFGLFRTSFSYVCTPIKSLSFELMTQKLTSGFIALLTHQPRRPRINTPSQYPRECSHLFFLFLFLVGLFLHHHHHLVFLFRCHFLLSFSFLFRV